MNKLLLFTDGSVNTITNNGFGAFLAIPENVEFREIKSTDVKVKRFEETSSVKLELQTLLWALREVNEFAGKIILYTDSQNIIGLPGRRGRLENNNFYSKKGRRINNFELYQQFYQLLDGLNIELQKVTGHKKTKAKNSIDRLFTLVDRASRKAVRRENESV